MLGPLEVRGDRGEAIELRGQRQRLALLALILEADRPVPADRLMDLLWGEAASDATNALHTQIARLRAVLGADAVVTTPAGYRLAGATVDAAVFRNLLHEAAACSDAAAALPRLDAALALWRGAPYPEAPDWDGARAEAADLEELYAAAREDRAERLLSLGRAEAVLGDLERMLATHSFRERPCELLMRALYACGRHADALAAYQRFRDRLGEELGLEPSAALRELEVQVLRHEVPGAPAAAPARPAAGATIPVPATSFVGRDADVAAITARLPASRLVTIHGPGGVGKTRLVLEVARQVEPLFPDGVHVVHLDELGPGGDVGAAVASALDVQHDAGASAVARVVEYLAPQSALLVLDSCEHALDAAAALLAALLPRTRGVHALATSREPLGVAGEHLWPLAPLPAGDGDGPAEALFEARARAGVPGFAITAGNAPLVAQVCRALDGLPLAIELAAARLRFMALPELATALDTAGGAPARGAARTAPARHHSIDALVAWSYDRLAEDEKRLFVRLAAFAGSFTVEAAVAVAAGADLPQGDVPQVLWALVDKSLVLRHEAPSGRSTFRVLETLRRFGRDRLDAVGARDELDRRHDAWVLGEVTDADTALRTAGPGDAIERFERVLPDVRVVVQRLAARGELESWLDLVVHLHWYAFGRMQSEMFAWITAAAEAGTGTAHPLLPAVLGSAGTGAWQRGDLAAARRFGERAVAAASAQPEAPFACRAYTALSDAVQFEGDSAAARELVAVCAQHARIDPDSADAVYLLASEAAAAVYGGDSAAAVPAVAAALAAAERGQNPTALAWAQYAAGEAAHETEPRQALEHLEAALRAARSVDDRFVQGVATLTAVTVQARLGDIDGALASFRGLLDHWRHAGVWTQQWTTLRNLLEVLVRVKEHRTAARLYGASQASAKAPPPYGSEAARVAVAVEAVRRRLGHRTFEDEVASGRTLTDEEAVELAMATVARLVAAQGSR